MIYTKAPQGLCIRIFRNCSGQFVEGGPENDSEMYTPDTEIIHTVIIMTFTSVKMIANHSVEA